MGRADAALKVLLALATAAGLIAIGLAGGGYDVVDRQTAGLLLWWAIGLGALVLPRLPGRPAAAGIAVTAFAALIPIWIALGLGDTLSTERTATELARYVAYLAPIVLVGWVLPRNAWRSVLAGLILGAVIVCALAFEYRLTNGPDPNVVFQNTTARLAYPFGYWNAVGNWAVVAGVLVLAVSAHDPRAWLRAPALATLPMLVSVAYVTYSRSSIAAAALGLVVLFALSRHRWTIALHTLVAAGAGYLCVAAIRAQPQIADATGTGGAGSVLWTVVGAGVVLGLVAAASGRFGVDRIALPTRAGRIVGAVTVVAAVAVLAGAGASYGPTAWDKFSTVEHFSGKDQSQRLTSINNGARVAQWRTALDDWKTHPARGSGAGTFELTYNLDARDGQFVRDAHSAYLESLSEQGTPGFLLLLGLTLSAVWAAIVAARRVWDDGADRGLIAGAGAGLAVFFFGTAFDWFWEVGALALLGASLLGVLVAAGRPAASVDEGDARRRSQWAARLVLAAAAVVCVLIQLPGLVGTSDVRRSQRALAAGNADAARSYADQAIDTLPWASTPFLQRALVDEQAGAYEAARDGITLAIRRDPYDWRLPLVLARIEARDGHPKAAIAAYRKAKSLRPEGEYFRR